MTASTRTKDLADLTAMIDAGSVAPVVERTFALADAAEAMRHIGSGHAHGKVVVTVG